MLSEESERAFAWFDILRAITRRRQLTAEQ
jgi:hypothetical protein